ncbi:MAG: hypothetical protein JJE13_09015 [Thermoleophilia bacterium]|nr:hypothetical protein [Thermoleophilia bacterium]
MARVSKYKAFRDHAAQFNGNNVVDAPEAGSRLMDYFEPLRRTRVKWGKFPRPDETADVYWAKKRPELAHITDAKLSRMMMEHEMFELILGEKLDLIDSRSQNLGGKICGRRISWTARQLELILVYRRLSGTGTIKRCLASLRGDHVAREQLGLGDDLPSAPTICRYKSQHFDFSERCLLYQRLDRHLRQLVVALPGLDKEAEKLGLDGSSHETHYMPPPLEKNRERFADQNVTAPDGGHRGGDKRGRGWQLLCLFTEHGTPLAWEVAPINEGEPTVAKRVITSYEDQVLPHRRRDTISVITCDGGFQGSELHQKMLAVGLVPNVHKASHSGSKTSRDNVAEKLATRSHFFHANKPHYANWWVNGLEELGCSCGTGNTERLVSRRKTGAIKTALKGSCSNCGNVTITSGKWRRSQNPNRIRVALDIESGEPSIGNPLNYYDPLAREYGRGRFSWNESLHATFQKRFGLLKTCWNKTTDEVTTEFAIAFSAISILLLERNED